MATSLPPSLSRPSRPRPASDRKIDFGIVTIREDENIAVLRRFGNVDLDVQRRRYRILRLALPGGDAYTVAVVRCAEQGNTEAQATARDLLDDLAPRFILVVGIAIRGISDVVGYRRHPDWTAYACETAAAFTRG